MLACVRDEHSLFFNIIAFSNAGGYGGRRLHSKIVWCKCLYIHFVCFSETRWLKWSWRAIVKVVLAITGVEKVNLIGYI